MPTSLLKPLNWRELRCSNKPAFRYLHRRMLVLSRCCSCYKAKLCSRVAGCHNHPAYACISDFEALKTCQFSLWNKKSSYEMMQRSKRSFLNYWMKWSAENWSWGGNDPPMMEAPINHREYTR